MKGKKSHYVHRHDNTHYTTGEIVVMRRAPRCTDESTKLQDRYRGPLIVTEALPADSYRVVSLNGDARNVYSTTAYVTQLKSWRLEEDEECPDDREDGELPGMARE